MSHVVQGEQFLHDLATEQDEPPSDTDDLSVPDEEDFDDDGSHFSTETVDDPRATDIYGQPIPQPGDEDGVQPPSKGAENDVIFDAPLPQNSVNLDVRGNEAQPTILVQNASQTIQDPSSDTGPPIPTGRSIAHHQFQQKKVAFLSPVPSFYSYCH